jgi:hypothetical protein
MNMTPARMISMLVGISLFALIAWVASKTSWEDTKVPMPPKGEALTNPFYVVQRFAEALGAHTAWDRVLAPPPTGSVIVLSAWHWNLTSGRREALERWVESGGRLVIDRTLAGGESEFERWSGIVRGYRELDRIREFGAADRQLCGRFQEEQNGTPSSGSSETLYLICELDGMSFLTTRKSAVWALRDVSGIQALRVEVGRGTVTVINATPFRERSLFEGDHGWLFVAATEMRRGDEVHFMSEDAHASLLALLWQHGAPVVVLALALVALVLWRGGVRFGPLAAAPVAARRSLVEQIRGTGQFALRQGSGDSLHAASVRALDEAAKRRVPVYTTLTTTERAAALARLTGFDRDALARAVRHGRVRRSHDLRSTIALLETARRRTLMKHTRSSHGTR